MNCLQKNRPTLQLLQNTSTPLRKRILYKALPELIRCLCNFSLLFLCSNPTTTNYKYILVVVDVFSKKAFTAYLKSKSSSDMIKAFEHMMPEIGKFSKLQMDMGRDFLNRPFQSWLKQRHIDHFHMQNFDTKATIAERFIHMLKERLWRYFTYTNSQRYVESALVESYNNTHH